MVYTNRKLTFMMTLVLALGVSASVHAASIGVNFVGGQGGPGVGQDLVLDNADGPAGVVVQSNWNNLAGVSGGPTALIDDSGALLTTTLQWGGSPNMFTTGNGSSTADHILMNGYLDTNNNSTTVLTLENIPYDVFDIIVYYDGGSTSRSGQYTVDTSTLAPISQIGFDNANFTGTFVQDDGTGSGGNYLLFSGLTGGGVDLINATPVGQGVIRAPINGIQIVEVIAVPEPTTAALGLLGVAGMVMRRRNHA